MSSLLFRERCDRNASARPARVPSIQCNRNAPNHRGIVNNMFLADMHFMAAIKSRISLNEQVTSLPCS